ncbi:unnamed protein product [Anisakis simplex]|uniref:Fibronectin type-III domain-containing protein n=1 Tax=Anisakis simplex TaxID=6269 RepID=A0A3P6N1W4_ANISI|nr:unnamed protein product [Anisakis simplex]
MYYLYEEAEPDTGYKVSVWAETNGGEGAKVMRAVRTWPFRNPDKPVFKAVSTSPWTAEIEWLPSNDTSYWAMPGSSFSVNYSVVESGEWKESEIVTLPNRNIFLDHLAEDTEYRIIGISREGTRQNTSDEMIIRSLSRATITHISRESLTSASWFIAVLFALLIALITAFIICCCQRQQTGKYSVKRKELEKGHQIDSDEHQKFMEYQYGFK